MAKKSGRVTEVFIDGSGGQAGVKSGFAWLIPGVAAKVQWISGLTCNEAEYRALLSAVAALPKGSQAVVKSDSLLVVNQYSGKYKVHDQKMEILLARTKATISARNLRIDLRWIDRKENQADALLRRRIGL
jgi:ribonuclease HI